MEWEVQRRRKVGAFVFMGDVVVVVVVMGMLIIRRSRAPVVTAIRRTSGAAR